MKKKTLLLLSLFIGVSLFAGVSVYLALTVPTDIEQPGTQPQEVGNLESPDKCDNCHGGYDASVEPAHNWRGSMMANAGRDPIFWATLAVVEQDFDGAGDLCIRCHSTAGWLAGRSTPTDGSGLSATSDTDGVECDYCHKLTNPDNSELAGEQNAPYAANDGGSPAEGYYGSGMGVIWGGAEKLGPYSDPTARHQFIQSAFHRSRDFCGTCHDVSNPAVGDLAHNHGIQPTADPVVASGVPGGPVDAKAAFNNPPYKYGIVERTFSEYKAGMLSEMLVSDYSTLPADLQGGALKAAYESAIVAGTGGNYEDGSPRYFGCQTCHMRPVTGNGCNKAGAPLRKDLPLHDMTGGNYWMPDAITYMNSQDTLLLGGGLTANQLAALADGKTRAMKQLSEAASLQVNGNVLKVINMTGHKVITGYPEGRRMWLNIKWYDAANTLLREDGKYGKLALQMDLDGDGNNDEVDTILNLYDANTKIYEAHYGMTKEWAAQLVALGKPAGLVLSYDRVTGTVDYTLGQLANEPAGAEHETFHFVINNTVMKDNRIPPYGMRYDVARARNALPVPADQYGNPGPGGQYNYWDEFTLNPPAGAVYALIDLVYQPTSWEYIQFLYLGNNGQNTFLANEGVNLLDAWLNTGMAAPYVMTSTTWGSAPTPPTPDLLVNSLTTWEVNKQGNFSALSDVFRGRDTMGIRAFCADDQGSPLSGVQVFLEIRDNGGNVVTSPQAFSDTGGNADVTWKVPRNQAAGPYTVNITDCIINGYNFNAASSTTSHAFAIQ
jgi:hypothetical protein